MKYFFSVLAILFVWQAQAQEELVSGDSAWSYALKTGINFNQTAFSDNWAGGGVGSLALSSYFFGTTLYQKEKVTWRNELQLQYGIINAQDQDTRKTVDRIFFDSKFGYKLSEFWNLYSSLSFLTQFAPGYQFEDDTRNQISDFMAPAFITSSWGFEYVPSDWFWLRIGPFSPRITIVTDQDLYLSIPENYGVPIGETVRYEWLAYQMTAELDKDLNDNLNIKARYNLFANYESLSLDKIDHFLEVLATSQVTRFIDVTLGLNLIYDFDQDQDVQLSQLFGVGLLYKVGNLKED
ncbi:MAG: DUF3078 domain-containing protein [Candidatus Cyclobacteriaceae bacterium M3_2C_046]